MKVKLYNPLKLARGIGATDILVGLLVTSILALILYNVHLRMKESRQTKAENAYLTRNASLALKMIVDDLVNSQVYAAGCRNTGLFKAKYGGIDAPDEIRILTGSQFSVETLKEDMVPGIIEIPLELGTSFSMQQELAICDKTDIEWFNVNKISHNAERGVSIIIPKLVEGMSPLNKNYSKGSTVGAFEEVRYYVGESRDGKPVLYRACSGKERIVAVDIENLKFEYYESGSEIPTVAPISTSISAVKITVVARSQKENLEFLQGTHSLTGMGDGFMRLNLSAMVPFDPVDTKVFEHLYFRIVKDKKSGVDVPLISPLASKAKEEDTEK